MTEYINDPIKTEFAVYTEVAIKLEEAASYGKNYSSSS